MIVIVSHVAHVAHMVHGPHVGWEMVGELLLLWEILDDTIITLSHCSFHCSTLRTIAVLVVANNVHVICYMQKLKKSCKTSQILQTSENVGKHDDLKYVGSRR